MKRLLTFLGIAALSCGAFAEQYFCQATLEPLALDAAIDTSLGDDGTGKLYSHWHTDSEQKILCTVAAYASELEKYSYPVGTKMGDAGPGDKYLSITVEDLPLYRTLRGGYGDGFVPKEESEMASIGDGKIVDALVQFVSANDTGNPDDELENHDKIAVWLYASETVTNIYVTAADGLGNSFNFKVNASVDVGSWHRVTVRAMKNTGDGRDGFNVYIDGGIVTAEADEYDSAMAGLNKDMLSPEELAFYNRRQLFRSRIDASHIEAGKFLAVGLKGEGSVDDITIADFEVAPSFVEKLSAFQLNWTANVTGFKINGVDFNTGTTSGSTNMVLSSEATINITEIDRVPGYNGPDHYVFNVSDQYGWIRAAKGNFAIVKTGTYEQLSTYETLSAAIATATNDVNIIMMMADFDVSTEIYNGGELEKYGVDEGKHVIIDLAGNTIMHTNDCQDVLFYVNGELTVYDSVGSGKIEQTKVDGEEAKVGIFAGEGKVNIVYNHGDNDVKLATFDGNIYSSFDVEDSEDTALLSLQGGYFNDERVTNTVAEAWYYEDDKYQAKYVTDDPLCLPDYFLILLAEKPDEPEEIKLWPGDNGGFATEDAANNAAKKTNIVAPLELGYGLSAYQNLFKVSVKSESGGTWTVVVALSDEAVTTLQGQLEERVKEITLAAIESGSVVYTGTVTPGLYYRIVYGSNVGAISTNGAWELANKYGNVTLQLDKPSEEAGFYRLEADATKYDVND